MLVMETVSKEELVSPKNKGEVNKKYRKMFLDAFKRGITYNEGIELAKQYQREWKIENLINGGDGTFYINFKTGKKTKFEFDEQHKVIRNTPKMTIKSLKRLASDFNMVILPVEYVELQSLFELEEKEGSNGFTKDILNKQLDFFKNNMEYVYDESDYYIICPLEYYEVWNHIINDEAKDTYFPEHIGENLTSLELLIPAQRNMYKMIYNNALDIEYNQKEINNLKKESLQANKAINKVANKVNKLEYETMERFLKVEKDITDIKTDVSNLKDEVAEVKKTQEEQAKQIESLNINLSNTKAEMREQKKELEAKMLRYLDPIIFRSPKNLEFENPEMDNIVAMIGLSWGKDIDDALVALKNRGKNGDLANYFSVKNVLKRIEQVNKSIN